MRKMILSALLVALTLSLSAQTYLDPNASLDERVEDALQRMTLQEKINILHAQSKFSSPGVPRLGIPELWCTDGPHGIRPEVKWDEWDQANWTNDSCTAFPALTCLAATWNTEMAALYGKSIGEEALYRRKSVLLGPGVNIYRTPLGGRNFEYMGEDPYLSASMVVPYIKGVQANGVATCVKHYALNNQEYHRLETDVVVSDRALYEIYLPAFRAAVVEGGSWAIMSSYNAYNGSSLSENHRLLTDILRNEWHFDGTVISDWGGVYSTDGVITSGLDLEFGTEHDGKSDYSAYYQANPYLKKIQSGEVGTEELDTKVRHILKLIFRTSMNSKRAFGSLCSDEHIAAARKIADEGIVLLKNNQNLLPVHPATDKRILVVGENAIKMMTVGGGSSSLKVKKEVLPLEALQERAAQDGIQLTYARGYIGDIGGEYNGVTTGQSLQEDRSAEELIAEAVTAAKQADLVIFVGGLNKAEGQDSEGADRTQYALPYNQDAVIAALAKANPRLAVVMLSGNAYAMPWLNQVPAVVQGWFGGSEAGHAIADVLFGDVNPSGKLPFTIMPALTDYAPHQFGKEAYPGVAIEPYKHLDNRVVYKEDIFVGYRFADLSPQARKVLTGKASKTKPLFAFGHGLSYTSFAYDKAMIQNDELTLTVTNTGSRAGAEVVQLYVAPVKPSVTRPVKELKAFTKVMLQPGETCIVTFPLTETMFQYYNESSHAFTLDKGQYRILAGSASDDIRAEVSYQVK